MNFQWFREAWLAAWNSHPIEAILSHYAPDVIVKSPFIAAAVSGSRGTIEGKRKLREIFSKAPLKYPDLHFQVLKVLAGTERVVMHDRSAENLLAAETFWLNAEGKARIVLVTVRWRETRGKPAAARPVLCFFACRHKSLMA